MKLIAITLTCLFACAAASPRRYQQQRPQKPSANKVKIPDSIENEQEAIAFLEALYIKHGEPHADKLDALVNKLKKGIQKGQNTDQDMANVKAILVNNSKQFGLSPSETRLFLDSNQSEFENLVASIDVTELQNVVDQKAIDVLSQGFDDVAAALSNKKVSQLLTDVKSTAVKSAKKIVGDKQVNELVEDGLEFGLDYIQNNDDLAAFMQSLGF